MSFRKIAILLYFYIARNKKNNLTIQQYNNRKSAGFTLIELMVVLSITAVLGILGIAGFTKYNQVQVLQTSVNNLTTTLNLARSRAASQVKPSVCVGQLDGYSVFISPPKRYELNVVCSDRDFLIQRTALPDNITFTQSQSTRIFFPVLGGKITGAGTIELSGYGQIKKIVINESGILVSALIPSPNTSPRPTPTPTPFPTSTPRPTPTPLPPIRPSLAYKRVFVTSTAYTGNLGGLAGADTKCKERAAAAFNRLGGEWVAWLSTTAPLVNAKDRIQDTEYRRLDNVIVAEGKADFIDGNIDNAISINENNIAQSRDPHVWTATDEQGNAHPNNCNQWTDGGGLVPAMVGDLRFSNQWWTNSSANTGCFGSLNSGYRLYCFEQ